MNAIKKQSSDPIKILRDSIIMGIKEKKGEEIIIMDMRHIKNAIVDYFIICSGNSDTHLDSISSAIDDFVYQYIQKHPYSKEGTQTKEWVLIDYLDVIVHIFKKERRVFYALETLWGDAKIESIK
ncbi:MAG: ribosome silencing factor [Chitinophagaceae bacterium]|nr:ribosome silencing factor [Chitinophagaceae bacterium]